jgi:hypothetical protein
MTRASLLILALAVGGMACSDAVPITGPGPAPTAPPAPPAPPTPAGSWVVRGTVFEDLPVFPDERPLAGVPLRVFGGGRIVEVISGADGSYAADMPATASFVRVVASGPDYFSPCPSFRWSGAFPVEEPLDVHVSSGAVLHAHGTPNLPTSGKAIWGRVFERISGRLEPVSGAIVTLHGSERLQNPVANSVTDERGMYEMCYVTPPDYLVEARKEGYAPVSVPAVIGWEHEMTDLILTRQ